VRGRGEGGGERERRKKERKKGKKAQPISVNTTFPALRNTSGVECFINIAVQ
jgi:hypothetical protein